MSTDSSIAPRPILSTRPSNGRDRKANKVNSLDSLTAGGLAGAVEGLVTFPTDLCKTRLQLVKAPIQQTEGLVSIFKAIYLKDGLKGFYAGAPPVVVGNAAKSCVRFATYERFKQLFRDTEGKVSRFSNLLAGLLAGTAESIVAVTPSEAIKTRLIQDACAPKPQYRSATHALRKIIKEEGVSAIYKGLGSVILKQGTNSAVRFSAYTFLTEQYDRFRKVDAGQRSNGMTFALGALSGVITVYASQPFDVAKTRFQAGNVVKVPPHSSLRTPNNTFSYLYHLAQHEGVKMLWKGSSMRLLRLSMSGGIQFFIYEKAMDLLSARV